MIMRSRPTITRRFVSSATAWWFPLWDSSPAVFSSQFCSLFDGQKGALRPYRVGLRVYKRIERPTWNGPSRRIGELPRAKDPLALSLIDWPIPWAKLLWLLLCDGRNSQRYATLAATLDDESWDTTLGIQPLSVSAFHFSREPTLQSEAGRDRIQMELNAPSAALTDPTPFPNQGGFFKQRWLDRQDVITSHVLRLIDPIENQQLHFLLGSDLSHVSRVRGSYFWVQQIYWINSVSSIRKSDRFKARVQPSALIDLSRGKNPWSPQADRFVSSGRGLWRSTKNGTGVPIPHLPSQRGRHGARIPSRQKSYSILEVLLASHVPQDYANLIKITGKTSFGFLHRHELR
jgi:hypothetical protein